MNAAIYRGEVYEDGAFSALARVCSIDGTGDEVVTGEGNVLLPVDVDSIECRVFDLGTDDSSDGVEITPAPDVTPEDNLSESLQTAGWGADLHGYNFRHDIDAAYCGDPGEYVRVEYKFNLAGGGVAWFVVIVKTLPVRSS